jgi:hypothetical protein
MTDTRPSDRTNTGAPLLPGLIKGAAIAGAMTWVLALLAFLTADPRGLNALAPFLLLVVATLFLLIFALPALLIGCLRGRSSS